MGEHFNTGHSFIVLSLALLFQSLVYGQEPAQIFKEKCASCHSIGAGRLVGPDLKDVASRQKREWLVEFIVDPKKKISGGDPYAQKLVSESRGVIMPSLNIESKTAEKLLDYIGEQSRSGSPQGGVGSAVMKPFSGSDVERGRLLFIGAITLANGASACVSCHGAAQAPLLGGGQLGPDLTRVFERLGGRQGLSAWLTAPATPTMSSVFKNRGLTEEEINSLVAYLEDRAKTGREEDPSVATLNFFLLGLGGTVTALVLFETAWRKRFRGVRRALVLSAKKNGEE
ncbi:MAG: c-type cytochrome [Acidobacteria bacterium]|nr:c-type cytochrome [Acidobacteriota bacterium]